VRLWIDTDVGDNPDDAIALLVAAAAPDVDLVGVSTVGGDTERRAAVARALVDAPVIGGADPGRLGRAILDRAPDAVLAIGPLTNVAALVAGGLLPGTLACMGGALRPVRHRGAVRAVEHNFGRDPDAARLVLAATTGTFVVPLDVTVLAALDAAALARLRESAPAVHGSIGAWLAEQQARGVPDDEIRVVLHDPLALLALLGDATVVVEPRPLTVEPDGRLVELEGAPAHQLAVAADGPGAVARVLEMLT
jgi:inosine-uridine nucleoside N-ribohydrolase